MPWESIALRGRSRDPRSSNRRAGCVARLLAHTRYAAVLLPSRNNGEVSTISPSSPGGTDDHAAGGAGLSICPVMLPARPAIDAEQR